MQFPKGFKEKYEQLLGEESEVFFDSLQKAPEKGFRLNPLKENKSVMTQSAEKVEWTKDGYRGTVDGLSAEHQGGYVYGQEPSAMFVAEVLDAKPGQRILDLCAAPGGKSTQTAGQLQGQGWLVSNEINAKRAKILSENIERFGVTNAVVLSESPDRLSAVFPDFFDGILVDAPCSGEGMFRKDPGAMEYWDTEYPSACAVRQKDILDEAVKMLAPGGTLVYSTCTFAPEENEQIMTYLLNEYPHLEAVKIPLYEGMVPGRPEWAENRMEVANAVRLFPHHIQGEGHFVAKLKDTRDGAAKGLPYNKPNKLTKSQVIEWETFWKETLTEEPTGIKLLKKDQLFLLPEGAPKIKGLKVLREGVHAGTFKKNRFEPNHALALALPETAFQHRVELTEEEYRRYLHGETLETGKNRGWLAIQHQGFIVGWGKEVKGTVKNFYPKGLRV